MSAGMQTLMRDGPPLSHEERMAWAKWREDVWRTSLHELWGTP